MARRQRRMFLGFCFGTAAVGTGAYWAGRGTASGSEQAPSTPRRKADPKIQDQLGVAHRLALGPEADLREQYTTLMLMHDAVGGDDVTWLGVQRLACSCVRADDPLDARIAQRVLTSWDASPTPDAYRGVVDLLAPRLKAFKR